jgi:hypothetical protein
LKSIGKFFQRDQSASTSFKLFSAAAKTEKNEKKEFFSTPTFM